jgi:hypothetical protein
MERTRLLFWSGTLKMNTRSRRLAIAVDACTLAALLSTACLSLCLLQVWWNSDAVCVEGCPSLFVFGLATATMSLASLVGFVWEAVSGRKRSARFAKKDRAPTVLIALAMSFLSLLIFKRTLT